MPRSFNYSQRRITPSPQTREAGVSLMAPIGGMNLALPPQNIEDSQVADARDCWINNEGRLSGFFKNAAFSEVLDTDAKVVEQFEYERTSASKFHMVAWDDATNLKVGYVDTSGNKTELDGSLTTGEVPNFEAYLGRDGTLVDSGTATSGGASTLTDSGASFTVDDLKGKVLLLTGGTGADQAKLIKGNTATEITIDGSWRTNPDATTTYEIREVAFALYYITATGGLKTWNGTDTSTALGDSTTQFDITNTSGDTYRYTYDATGTDPSIGSNLEVGRNVDIQAENFDPANNGFFVVTAVDTNYFEVTNASGVVESNKTIGTGSLTKMPVKSYAGAPKGTVLRLYKDIMFIAGNPDNESLLYASTEFNPVDYGYNDYGTIGSVNPDGIKAIGIFRGTLIVGKSNSIIPVGIEEVDGQMIFTQGEIDETRGCLNPRCMVEADGELIVWDSQGLYMYGYAPSIDKLGVQERLSDNIKPSLDTMGLDDAYMFYDNVNDVVYMSCTDSGSTDNDVTWIYDWRRRNLVTAFWRTTMAATSFLVFSGSVYIGSPTGGTVNLLSTTAYIADNYVLGKAMNLGSSEYKIFDFIKMNFRNVTGKVGVKIFFGLDSQKITVYDEELQIGTESGFGGGVGDDPVGFVGVGGVLPASGSVLAFVPKKIRLPYHHSLYAQVRWYNSTEQNFELEKYSLEADFLSEIADSPSIY